MNNELNDLFKNEIDLNAKENNIFYVSKNLNLSKNFYNSLNEAINNISEIIENNLFLINEIFVIKIFPGNYKENIRLPPNVFLQGYDKDLVFLNFSSLNCFMDLTTNNYVSNLTIKYFNNINNLKRNFINIDSNNFNENYSFNKSNRVIIKNVNFIFEDIYLFNIFNIKDSIVIFDKCSINIDNIKNIKFNDNYNLFNIEIGSQLKLGNTDIEFNINSIFYTFIKSILSNINIFNCNIKYNLLNEITCNYYIFNDTYSNIEIFNSNINNSCLGGKFFNLDDDNYLETFINFKDIIINDKFIEINNYKSKSLIKQIKGICLNGFNYIFFDKNFINDKKVIISYNKFKQDRVILEEGKILFSFKIQNSYLYNPKLDKNKIYSPNYIIDIYNTYIEEYNYKGICNYSLNNEGILVGTSILKTNGIVTDNIYSNCIYGSASKLTDLGLKKINKGYGILNKYNTNLGENSINLGFNTKSKNTSGKNSFTTGIDNNALGLLSNSHGINNISKGNYSSSFGEGNISNNNHSFSIGKYNNYLGDNIFSIGNGKDNENRKNILQVDYNGNLTVDNKIKSKVFTDDYLNIEKGNILGALNIEVQDNLFCDGDITLNGKLRGKDLKYEDENKKYYNHIKEFYSITTNDITISTIKIDLCNLIIPNKLGAVIGPSFPLNCSLGNICEDLNGIVYKIKIFCVETPDFPEIRFIASTYSNDEVKVGTILENKLDFNKDKNLNLFHSYNWKKGNNKKNKEFEFYDLGENFNIYMIRRNNQKMELNNYKKNLFKKGKFLINIYGVKSF